MGKTYSKGSSEVDRCIMKMQSMHHPELKGVTVKALFIFDEEKSDVPCLKHGGYPALATIKITSVKERALGLSDAVMIIDRASWLSMKSEPCEALIDHELTHLERVLDEETKKPVFDSVNRPKLTSRRHDHQMGWFSEVAERHGEHSPEVRQARSLIAETGQLYFNFAPSSIAEATRAALENPGTTKGGVLADGTKFTVQATQTEEPPDELYDSAATFVTECGLESISISRIQTQLKIGYNRAARLLEALEAKGYVGALLPGGGRPVLAPRPTAH